MAGFMRDKERIMREGERNDRKRRWGEGTMVLILLAAGGWREGDEVRMKRSVGGFERREERAVVRWLVGWRKMMRILDRGRSH